MTTTKHFVYLYVLAPDGTTPVPVTSAEQWGLMLQDDARRIVEQTVVQTVPLIEVSTIFIGIDYSFGRTAQPTCWETMVFGGDDDRWCRRYTSHAEALKGHRRVVKFLQRGLPIAPW